VLEKDGSVANEKGFTVPTGDLPNLITVHLQKQRLKRVGV